MCGYVNCNGSLGSRSRRIILIFYYDILKVLLARHAQYVCRSYILLNSQKTLLEAKRTKKQAKREKKRLRAEKTAGIADPDPSVDMTQQQQQQQEEEAAAAADNAIAPGTALTEDELREAIVKQNIRRNRAKKVMAVLQTTNEQSEI